MEPAVPWGVARLRAYSYETHVAGIASSALHKAPRRTSDRKSKTARANTSAATEKTPNQTEKGVCCDRK